MPPQVKVGVDWSCDYGDMGMTLMNGDEGGGVGGGGIAQPERVRGWRRVTSRVFKILKPDMSSYAL